jgi:hypothetical protein
MSHPFTPAGTPARRVIEDLPTRLLAIHGDVRILGELPVGKRVREALTP